ncbi:hypothetical protein [Loigolactobacillus bifermentans]|jgi:hypothetical protein|uniref:Uncharacterized protein n=1 Tax=Loigolactobacillus bifermentans DSM 20003 TaxID=1423726 RepID=A0A0R1GYI0_9LACO|nr:hypothetical protein [Loigolactobacillus bifermentans]KRK39436.1 hypothetical protein FC07_GL002403 [Loigolactobacillus bifermentans DSM 20003]QGG61204.1 hypothetical protein LB003_12440 [Loigolactobacillus bifermentans]
MRQQLGALGAAERHQFVGTFKRYGFKTDYGHAKPTLLLVDVTLLPDQWLTDHAWFNLTKGFATLGQLQSGDQVQFNGRVARYQKGYRGHNFERRQAAPLRWDYKIERPTKVQLVDATLQRPPLPTTQFELLQMIAQATETTRYLPW